MSFRLNKKQRDTHICTHVNMYFASMCGLCYRTSLLLQMMDIAMRKHMNKTMFSPEDWKDGWTKATHKWTDKRMDSEHQLSAPIISLFSKPTCFSCLCVKASGITKYNLTAHTNTLDVIYNVPQPENSIHSLTPQTTP